MMQKTTTKEPNKILIFHSENIKLYNLRAKEVNHNESIRTMNIQ